jgi:peptidoglycan/xylan/chitin deacetylase (PgdA/CDA1 family)
MRTIGAAILLPCVLAGVQPASAQEACGPDKLGVSRTATINAVGGAHFGAQYKSPPLLADGEVVLTFDDGPSRVQTRPILEALAAHCTKATFFMLGQMALAEPQLVKEVASRGHTVATHTWSHPNLQHSPQDKAQNEIEMGFSAVQQASGKPIAPFFRFPYLRDTPLTLTHLRSRQMAIFGIDIDSRDFETREASAVYERVLRDVSLKRKGIILFHDIHGSTARALPRILEELKRRGFRVVHLSPKAAAETLAEYDALARQAAERRSMAAAANPLSRRALVWPSSALPGAVESKEPVPASAPAPRAPPGEEDWTINFWRQAH